MSAPSRLGETETAALLVEWETLDEAALEVVRPKMERLVNGGLKRVFRFPSVLLTCIHAIGESVELPRNPP